MHESLINYGGNKKPEFITCMHEESRGRDGARLLQGRRQAADALCHGTVGLQHATMAIYNAWCDRVPVIVIVGNDSTPRAAAGRADRPRRAGHHALVRDFTKWDDKPVSLQHFAQSIVRAYKIAMTPPTAPVAIALDARASAGAATAMARNSIFPNYTPSSPPAGGVAGGEGRGPAPRQRATIR